MYFIDHIYFLFKFHSNFVIMAYSIFALIIIIAWLIIGYIFKLKKWNLILVVANIIFSFLNLILVYSFRMEAQFQLLWEYSFLINYPISSLFFLSWDLLSKILNCFLHNNHIFWAVNSICLPFFFFFVFGALQYFLIGSFIDWLIKKIKD